MRVHHLNCGTDCPFGGAFFDGRSKGALGHLVCHCLLIETDTGLVLVDTGYGLKDVKRPFEGRIPKPFAAMLNIRLREEETAIRQIERLGFSARDVRHIVLTHLDFDHAGGLEDFPEATVHLMGAEMTSFRKDRQGFVMTNRYRPMQIDEVHSWRTYEPQGEPWFGFSAVRQLEGLPPEILLIPLKGHTQGHAGVAVQTGTGWLLHAGDAYFYRDEVRRPDRRCTPGLRFYQNMMEVDRASRLHNQQRLRELSLDGSAGVRMICAHDVVEYEAAAAGRLL
ncbi:MBL fold metallo-hydrolase [Phenylobacterium deserti]|uniref:MBL fold metallo-hydrolase n=1 Tax=Phenylobacterium deserti TaxID=1914756 RepID=A0A328AQ11_9CAUL|nr:MBL fold metallo-hydrolase [Phenylobacterium deserti]RAK56659.1 MBL fold metallo-hydrolase [Phenylobacterium deserti]